MSEATVINLLSRLGVKADSAEGNHVKLTMVQADKLMQALPDTQLVQAILKENRVVVEVDLAALQTAVESNKRAPRTSANVQIASRMVYEVTADGTNEVTSAWWESATDSGEIVVNGVAYPIETGVAADFYTIDEDNTESSPDRKVYVVTLPTVEGNVVLTSYGITNLIRRVCAVREVIG